MANQMFTSNADPTQVQAYVDVFQSSMQKCGFGNVTVSHLVPNSTQSSSPSAPVGIKRDSNTGPSPENLPQPKEAKTS
eukprot:10674269-Karenia_brevis.AAC.1